MYWKISFEPANPTEIFYKNFDTLERARQDAIPVLMIQRNCRKEHTSANCEQSDQGRGLTSEKKAPLYKRTMRFSYKLHKQIWVVYVHKNLLIQLNIEQFVKIITNVLNWKSIYQQIDVAGHDGL